MTETSPLVTLLLAPPLWGFLLVLLITEWLYSKRHPKVHKKFARKGHNPGDLFANGSGAGSKLEDRVRHTIKKAGYRLYKKSTCMLTPEDAQGKTHKYTPDIMMWKPKMIVEVDPDTWHGQGGAEMQKINHDIDRNIMYARLGYTVVRIRIGGAKPLSPNDVVIPYSDYVIERDSEAVLAGVRKAKFIKPEWWTKAEFRNKYLVEYVRPGGQ